MFVYRKIERIFCCRTFHKNLDTQRSRSTRPHMDQRTLGALGPGEMALVAFTSAAGDVRAPMEASEFECFFSQNGQQSWPCTAPSIDLFCAVSAGNGEDTRFSWSLKTVACADTGLSPSSKGPFHLYEPSELATRFGSIRAADMVSNSMWKTAIVREVRSIAVSQYALETVQDSV